MKQELQNTKIASWTRKWAAKQNLNYIFYKQTTSTNDKAKEHLFGKIKNTISPSEYFHSSIDQVRETDFPQNKKFKAKSSSPLLFIAKSQTRGRGRRSRHWINSDMMISWSYIVKQAPQPIITSLMGEALHKALKNSWEESPFKIKKPNDIYINNKKLAGLLVEVVNKGSLHQLVIGVGMNVFSHPSSGFFTHLQEHVQKKITERKWSLFLDEWYKQIYSSLITYFKV